MQKWKALDTSEGGPVSSFIEWFLQYKNAVVKEGLLRCNRQRAGLGDPPSGSPGHLSLNDLSYPGHLSLLELQQRPENRATLLLCSHSGPLNLETSMSSAVNVFAHAIRKRSQKVPHVKNGTF